MKIRLLSAVLGLTMILVACGGKSEGEEKGSRFLRVSQILGQVEVKLAGGAFRLARAGMRLGEKDQVKTIGAGSSCLLRTPGGSVVRLSEDSLLVMAKLYRDGKLKTEKTGLILLAGRVIIRAKRLLGGEEFTVRTKGATAGVRGTEFIVSVDTKSNTRVAVKRGKVMVRRILILKTGQKVLRKALEEDTEVILMPAQQVTIQEKDNRQLVKAAEEVVKNNVSGKDAPKLVKLIKREAVKQKVDTKPAPAVFNIRMEPKLNQELDSLGKADKNDSVKKRAVKTPVPAVRPNAPVRKQQAPPAASGEGDESSLSKKQQEEQEQKRLLEERRKKMEAARKKALQDDEALRNRKTTDDRR